MLYLGIINYKDRTDEKITDISIDYSTKLFYRKIINRFNF